MANTILPSQLGYTAPNSPLRSQVYIGKKVSASFEAIGLGERGRPDELQALKIYLSENGEAVGAVHLDVTDLYQVISENASLKGKEVFLKFRTVSVCEVNDETGEAEEKKMVILGSETF